MKYFMSDFNTRMWSLPSLLDGAEYPQWKQEMQWFLCINHPMLWKSISIGPHIPVTKSFNGLDSILKHPTEYTEEDKVLCEKDTKALECLQFALPQRILSVIGNHGTAFNLWNALRVKFEGNPEEKRSNQSKEATTTITHQSTLTVNINELSSEVTQGLCSQLCTDKVLNYRRHNQTLIDESKRISKANDELIKNEKIWEEKVDSLNKALSDLRDTIGVKNAQLRDLLSRFTKAKSELSEAVDKLTKSEFKLTQMHQSSEALKLALNSGKTNKNGLGYNAMPPPNDYAPLPKVVNLTDLVKTNSLTPDPNFNVSAATTEKFIVSNADQGVKVEEDCVLFEPEKVASTSSSTSLKPKLQENKRALNVLNKRVYKEKTVHKQKVVVPKQASGKKVIQYSRQELLKHSKHAFTTKCDFAKDLNKTQLPKKGLVNQTPKFGLTVKESIPFKINKKFVNKEKFEPRSSHGKSFAQYSQPKFTQSQQTVYMTKTEAAEYRKRKISERKLIKKYGWKPKEIWRPKSQLSKDSESERIWKPKSVKVKSVSHDSKRKNEAHSKSMMVFRPIYGSDNCPKIEKDMSDLICLKIKVYDLKGRPKFVDAWVPKCN